VTIPMIFVLHLFYNLAYTPVLVAYTLEILPVAIRAKGFAVVNLTVSLALALNQFVDPWAFNQIGWKYYIVYCGWLAFELLFVMLLAVETRGKTPEEIAVIFDGERKPDDLPHVVYDTTAISMSDYSIPSVEQDESFTCTCKAGAAEVYSYRLKRPHRVVDKDQLGYSRARVRVL